MGNNDERRFRVEDLEAFVEGRAPAVLLAIAGWQTGVPAHISHFYRSEEESLDVGTDYVKQGLDLGELVLVMAPEAPQCR